MSENQKKIWITGASSGIGKAVAEKFARETKKHVNIHDKLKSAGLVPTMNQERGFN